MWCRGWNPEFLGCLGAKSLSLIFSAECWHVVQTLSGVSTYYVYHFMVASRSSVTTVSALPVFQLSLVYSTSAQPAKVAGIRIHQSLKCWIGRVKLLSGGNWQLKLVGRLPLWCCAERKSILPSLCCVSPNWIWLLHCKIPAVHIGNTLASGILWECVSKHLPIRGC